MKTRGPTAGVRGARIPGRDRDAILTGDADVLFKSSRPAIQKEELPSRIGRDRDGLDPSVSLLVFPLCKRGIKGDLPLIFPDSTSKPP